MRLHFILNQCLYSAFNFLVLIIGAKVLSSHEYATYGFIYSFYLIVFSIPFALLYLPMLSNAITNKQSEQILLILSSVTVLAGIIFCTLYLKFEFSEALIVGLMLVTSFVYDYKRRLLMLSESIKQLNVYEISRLVIFIVLLFCLIISEFTIRSKEFIAIIVASNLIVSSVDIKRVLFSIVNESADSIKLSMKQTFNFGKWLLVNNLMLAMSGNVFVFVVASISTTEKVASLTAYRSVLGVFTILLLAVDNYLSPKLARSINSSPEYDIVKLINKEMLIFTPLFLVGILFIVFFGRDVIISLYGPGYGADFNLLILLLVSTFGMFIQRFPLIYIRTYKENKSIFRLGLIISIMNLILIYPVGLIWNVEGILFLLAVINFIYFILLWKKMRFIRLEKNK